MDRRRFLQRVTATAVAVDSLPTAARAFQPARVADLAGHTLLCEFERNAALFCIPAQQTIPMLVRWMLALEDSDEDRLYLGKGLPREWVGSGKEIRIEQAPTRWGRVNFRLAAQPASHSVTATVELARTGAPHELHVKLRMPLENAVKNATVNGRSAVLGGPHGDTVIFSTGGERHFEIVGQS